MRPSALFVDCYGTLVEGDRPVIEAVTRAAAHRAGVDETLLDREWWQRFQTLCAKHTGPLFASQRDLELRAMADVLRDFGTEAPEDELVDLLQPLFDYWRTAAPLDDAVAFLRNWTDCPVLILSNIDRADLEQVLTNLPQVAGAITSEDARAYKPAAAVFRHALAVTGLAPDRVVHVGDSWESDVQGAADAGLTAVWLDRAGTTSPDGLLDVARIPTLYELPACIAALGGL